MHLGRLGRHWFLAALLFTLALGSVLGTHGPAPFTATAADVISRCATVMIFLVTGLSLPLRALLDWQSFCRLTLPVGLWTFACLPLLWLSWHTAGLPGGVGWGVLAVMPITITSCVALTTAADGRPAPAVQAAVALNLLGVLLVPWWLMLIIGEAVVTADLWVNLLWLVVVPVLVGTLTRPLMHHVSVLAAVQSYVQVRSGVLCQLFLLGILLAVAVHLRTMLWSWQAAGILLCAGLIHALLVVVLIFCSRWWASVDRPAIIFCAGQKSIATGLPLLAAALGSHTSLAWTQLALPLVAYHLMQLLIDAPVAYWWHKRHAFQPGSKGEVEI
jgi:predicted Na+-dependent transporter